MTVQPVPLGFVWVRLPAALPPAIAARQGRCRPLPELLYVKCNFFPLNKIKSAKGAIPGGEDLIKANPMTLRPRSSLRLARRCERGCWSGGAGPILRLSPAGLGSPCPEPGQHLPVAGSGLGSSGRAQISSSPERGNGADTGG